MNRQRIFSILLRQYYLLRQSSARFVPLFVWVAIDIILWGFITRYLSSIALPGVNYVSVFLGAILLWDFFVRVMQGVTMAFFEDVWSRNFLNLFATPLSVREYISGLVLSSIATTAIGLVAMVLVAHFGFDLSFAAYGWRMALFLLILFLCGIALGVVGCAIVLRYGPAAEWFIWPLPALLSPFSCVFYPLATLPHWMQAISHLLPPMYVFEAMRALAAGQAVEWGGFFAGIALAAFYLLCACLWFVRIYRHALRSGLIARYSAESLS